MQMQTIPISLLGESKLNPRRTYDEAALTDLADSIREQGILEPLLVRPISRAPGKFFTYEIVAGHRRARAAFRAGLSEVPCVVREMDDAQALEAALVENGQREDVTPLDEAQAFGALLEHGRSAEDIASRIGRSVGYVRSRLRLLELVPEVRALLEEGRIHVGSALLLAQVHEQQQREVAERIRRGVYRPRRDHDEPFTSADVASLLAERSRRMHLALWPLEDADLVPSAGACSTCPRRTGSQRALLAEMEGDDQCLDAECWSSKTSATVERARAAGELVLEGVALHRAHDAGAILGLDDECDEQDFLEAYEGLEDDRCLGWGDALKRIGATPTRWTLAVQPSGRVDRMVSAAHLADLVEPHWPDAARALRSRMRDEPASSPATSDEPRPRFTSGDEGEADAAELDDVETTAHAEEERAKREAEREKAAREAQAQRMAAADLAEAIVQSTAGDRATTIEVWRAIVRMAIARAEPVDAQAVAMRREMIGLAHAQALSAWVETTDSAADLRGLLFELIAAPALRSTWLFADHPTLEHGPYGIHRLLDAVGTTSGRALALARKRLADEEREAERAKKKAEKAAAAKSVKKAAKAREVRDGA